mgnify:CR=1 FL=1
MTTVEVAIPMLRGKRHFYIEKGRRWSVVEHLMLDAVARRPATASELSRRSNLPPRVVIEAFIRLMRAGWVELPPGKEAVFTATAAGKAQLDGPELHAATTKENRWMSFCYDQACGDVFRGKELFVHKQAKLSCSPESHALVYLERSIRHSTEDIGAIFAALVGPDELIVGMEETPDTPMEGYAIVKVKDGVIEQLPSRASEELRQAILNKAAQALPESEKSAPASIQFAPRPADKPVASVQGLFEQRDLLLDGSAHKAALLNVLETATELVIIHSTFISSDGWRALMPKLIGASARGAKIHILYGQSDEQNASSSSRTESIALRAAIAESGRNDQIIVHPFSTGSHAKILLSDNGQGRWSCIVGSCNWLSSDFSSYEASIDVRDPQIVGELVKHIANLSIAHDGIWTNTTAGFVALGRYIGAQPRGQGRTASMKILLAPEHASLVLEARDTAQKRLVVTSHRLGVAGKPMIIVPALAASRDKGVECSLFYGRATGRLSGLDAATLTSELSQSGVTPRPIHNPRLHAKVLAWDDNALAVTSQNWLSADPSDTAHLREIGIFVEQNKVADTFVRRFQNTCSV